MGLIICHYSLAFQRYVHDGFHVPLLFPSYRNGLSDSIARRPTTLQYRLSMGLEGHSWISRNGSSIMVATVAVRKVRDHASAILLPLPKESGKKMEAFGNVRSRPIFTSDLEPQLCCLRAWGLVAAPTS